MKLIMKHYKKVLASFIAVVLAIGSVPVINLKAVEEETTGTVEISYSIPDETEGNISVTLGGENKLQFSATEFASNTTKELKVKLFDSNGTAVENANITNVAWTVADGGERVIAVDENTDSITPDETGNYVIIPVGMGETEVIAQYVYNVATEGTEAIEESATATFSVAVFSEPKLEINVDPLNGTIYPNAVTITVTGSPDGIKPSLTIDNEEVALDENNSHTTTLAVGEHTFIARTEAFELYEASQKEVNYTVGKGEVDITSSGRDESKTVYYTDEITYTLTSNVAGIFEIKTENVKFTNITTDAADEVINKITASSEDLTANFTIKCDTVGETLVEFTFTPDDKETYDCETITDKFEVNKIPVKVVWDELTKIYDGTAEFVTTEQPRICLDEVTGYEITTLNSVLDEYTFVLSGANVGTYTYEYNGIFTLTDEEHYELKTVEDIFINIEPIELRSSDINVEEIKPVGKSFDGNSEVVFEIEPRINKSDKFVQGEFDDCKLGYTAKYYDTANNEIEGDSENEIIATRVVISSLQVLDSVGEVNSNYKFTENIEPIEGEYKISPNADFEEFTGIELGDPIEGVYWYNQNKEISREDFVFVDATNENWWRSTEWQETYIVGEDGDNDGYSLKEIAAKNSEGLISRKALVGFDSNLPSGNIYAYITEDDGERKQVNVTELTDAFNTIKKDSVIEIEISVSDQHSRMKSIEWYGSNKSINPITKEEDIRNNWPSEGTNIIEIEPDENADEKTIVKALGDKIDKTELKKFYYAKITDNAGNVSYISSSGVMQDITAPVVTEIALETPTSTYQTGSGENFKTKNVYSDGTVDFTVDLEETGIASGIVDVMVQLIPVKWEETGGSYTDTAIDYDIQSNIWEINYALQNIKDFSEIDYPTEEEISKVSTPDVGNTLSLKAGFTDLEDGHYIVRVSAKDKAGNVSEPATAEFIIDKTTPIANIDISGLVANKDVKVDEAYPDGIYTGGSIEIAISDLTLATIQDDLLSGIDGEKWTEKYSENGVKTYSTTIDFGNKTANKDGAYELVLKAVDSIGNVPNEECKISADFYIDGIAPTYTVVFSKKSENSTIIEKGGTQIYYYNSDIKATFEIIEAGTFDDNLINVVIKNAKGTPVMQWPTESNSETEDAAVSTPSPYVLEHEKNSNKYTLTIKADGKTDDDGYIFEIKGQDKAGNMLQLDEESNISKDTDNDIGIIRAMDTVKPVLMKVDYTQGNGEAEFNTYDGKDYFNAITDVTFTLKEHNPLASMTTITSEGEASKDWTALSDVDQYSLSLKIPMYNKGDEQNITVAIKDLAGNQADIKTAKPELRSKTNTTFVDKTEGTNSVSVFTDKFIVDTIVPQIEYEYIDYTPVNTVDNIDYFNDNICVKITIDEHNFAADYIEKTVGVSGKDEVGNPVNFEKTEWVTDEINSDIRTATYTFKADSEYDITISGTDCALNPLMLISDPDEDDKISSLEEATGKTTLKVAVDKERPVVGDNTKPVVVVTPSNPVGTTLKDDVNAAQALYDGSIIYEVVVYDPETNKFCSGIDNVVFTVTAEDGTKATGNVSKDGTISYGTEENGDVINEKGITVELVNVTETVTKDNVFEKLAKGVENQYVFNVTVDEKTFNSNGIVLSVEAKDVSTNKGNATAAAVAIDVITPQLIVSYNNNDVSNGRYFHQERIATIEVIERNFSNECVDMIVNGKHVILAFTLVEKGDGNRDNAVWRAQYGFTEDDDYTISFSCKDRAGNKGSVNYNGEVPREFTVDQTLPTIEVSFNSNKANNYYDSARTAVIKIVERNFNSNDVQIIGTALDDGAAIIYPNIGPWSSNGDTHIANITYSADALYTLDVAYSDLATNTAVQPGASTFTIDNVNPTITITGVEEGKAYSGEVLPQIRFNDKNYDSYEILLTRTERDKFGVDVTSEFVKASHIDISGTGHGTGTNNIADIEHIAENDGIYELTVKVYDKSGRSSEETVTYSVNRYGSVYVYSQDLAKLINGYHQNISGDLYITAYNADNLLENSTKLEISCDGATISGQVSNADVNSSLVSNEGWHEYKFELNPTDFAKDGSYIIMLSDMDEAGNTKTNSNEPIQFFVDKTAPILDSVIGLEESIINAEEKRVTYTLSDAIGLARIQILVDGKQAGVIENFENNRIYEGEFVLGSGMNQEVRIVASDKAGNVLDTAQDTFQPAFAYNSVITVSTNLLVRWYANTALFWGSIAGAVGLIVLSIAITLLKLRKDNVEAEEM